MLPGSKEISVTSPLTRLQKWLGVRNARRKPTRPHLHLEAMEDRLVPSSMSNVPFISPSGPTTLALNFDGGPPATESPNYQVSAYNAGNALQTDQNIQDILFRTSEMYAPFNVQVTRLSGADNFLSEADSHGPTTVFVGASIGDQPVGSGFASGGFSDSPTSVNLTHLRNSDPYDLALVDPAANGGQVANVSAAIAHESGHTFGLVHVRTDGVSFANDSSPLQSNSSTPDVMTCNYGAGLAYFADTLLPVSAWNTTSDGLQFDPQLYPTYSACGLSVQPVAQDSFNCLSQVLGLRTQDSHYHIADVGAIDPAHDNLLSTSDNLIPDSKGAMSAQGNLNRLGDYDVYRWTAPYAQTIQFNLQGSNGLTPELMVYDDSGVVMPSGSGGILDMGNKLLYLQDSFGARQAGATVQPGALEVQAGQVLYFVVGAQDGQSTGQYQLTVQEETHTVYVTQTNLHANVPNVPGSWGQVTASALYYVDGQTAPATVLTGTKPGRALIDVYVEQSGPSFQTYQGTVDELNGQGIVHFSTGQDEPLVIQNGHWLTTTPDGKVLDFGAHAATPQGQLFHSTFKVTVGAKAPPGTNLESRHIHLIYDLDSEKITGTTSDGVAVSGVAGQVITVLGGAGGWADVSFIVSLDHPAPSKLNNSALAGLLGNFMLPPGMNGPGAASQQPMANVLIDPAASAARINPLPVQPAASGLLLSRPGPNQPASVSVLALDLALSGDLILWHL
jgi:hypothetical protein